MGLYVSRNCRKLRCAMNPESFDIWIDGSQMVVFLISTDAKTTWKLLWEPIQIVICSWRTVDTCPNYIVDHTNPLTGIPFCTLAAFHWVVKRESRTSFGNFFFATLWGIFISQNRCFEFAHKSFASFLISLLFLSGRNQMVNWNEYLNSSKWVSSVAVVCANAKKKYLTNHEWCIECGSIAVHLRFEFQVIGHSDDASVASQYSRKFQSIQFTAGARCRCTFVLTGA